MRMDDKIKALLTDAFDPVHLEVSNESHLHAGHAGDDGSGQTHYSVMVVSDFFKGQTRIARQRAVMSAVKSLFKKGLHAFNIRAIEVSEFKDKL